MVSNYSLGAYCKRFSLHAQRGKTRDSSIPILIEVIELGISLKFHTIQLFKEYNYFHSWKIQGVKAI